jgi:hypothetical protein
MRGWFGWIGIDMRGQGLRWRFEIEFLVFVEWMWLV